MAFKVLNQKTLLANYLYTLTSEGVKRSFFLFCLAYAADCSFIHNFGPISSEFFESYVKCKKNMRKISLTGVLLLTYFYQHIFLRKKVS